MATISMFRGGTPDFKPMMCEGEYAQFTPPFSSAHFRHTPPFNSHADAAHGQGYLNLHFPLVPQLQYNDAHRWMRTALKEVKAVGDIIELAWVPLRSFVVAQYFERTLGASPLLDGVYVKPVAKRVTWDFDEEKWIRKDVPDYAAAITAAGITQFPLGKAAEGDQLYGFVNLYSPDVQPPCTFGHNIPKLDDCDRPVGGYDDYYGAVVLGYQIAAGAADKIAELWRGDFALYMSAKVLTFEGSTQVG